MNPILQFIFINEESEKPEIKICERLTGSKSYFENKKKDFMTGEKLYCSNEEY